MDTLTPTRQALLAIVWGAMALAPTRAADLPEQKLPVLGGGGGTAFTRDCGADRVITGFRYRTGAVVDAIGLLCRPVNTDGTLGAETTVGTLAGGDGGTSGFAKCPAGTVVGAVTIYFGSYVDGVRLICRNWTVATRAMGAAAFNTLVGRSIATRSTTTSCELDVQPGAAIRGRASGLVDAFGLTCDEP